MRLTDYIGLGFRNIWRHKMRSALTILAVVIGAISVTIMLSLVIGAERVATQQLEAIGGLTLVSVSPNPDATLNNGLISTEQGLTTSGIQLNDSTVESIRQISHVVDATPISGVYIQSMSLEGQRLKTYANIVAFTPGNKVLDISVAAGRKLQAGDMNKIIIGSRAAKAFGYADHPNDLVGMHVNLAIQGPYSDWEQDPPLPSQNQGNNNGGKMEEPRNISAEIVGVAAASTDDSQNFITLDWGRTLMIYKNWEFNESKRKELEQQQSKIQSQQNMMQGNQLPPPQINMSEMMMIVKHDNLADKGYASILVKVDTTEHVTEVGSAIKKMGFGVQTAQDMLDQIKKIFTMASIIIGSLGGIALFVAAIGIINTMMMATYERTREIGILRACGATKATIRKLFLFEAAMIGFWGGVFGIAASFGLAKIGNIVGNQIALSQGIPINNILSFPPQLIIGVIAITTLIGTIAGFLPAVHASKLDPVEALRYE